MTKRPSSTPEQNLHHTRGKGVQQVGVCCYLCYYILFFFASPLVIKGSFNDNCRNVDFHFEYLPSLFRLQMEQKQILWRCLVVCIYLHRMVVISRRWWWLLLLLMSFESYPKLEQVLACESIEMPNFLITLLIYIFIFKYPQKKTFCTKSAKK